MTADVKPTTRPAFERDGEKMPRLAQEPRGRVGINRIVEHIRRHVREHGLVAVPQQPNFDRAIPLASTTYVLLYRSSAVEARRRVRARARGA